MGRMLWKSSVFAVGVLVAGVSLMQLHQDSWADQYGHNRIGMKQVHEVRVELVQELPNSGVLPGNVLYPMQAAAERGWMYLGTGLEGKRRKLWLANQRLRMGYELVAAGNQVEGVETLRKAVGYLDEASRNGDVDFSDEKWDKELEWSLGRHDELLAEVEMMVNEELRPRVTELRGMSALCGK